jgi:hypothetical protein
MEWIKVLISGTPVMVNMIQYKQLEEDPGDATKCILTHNDATTITIDASFDVAVEFFKPLLYKEDTLSNPL